MMNVRRSLRASTVVFALALAPGSMAQAPTASTHGAATAQSSRFDELANLPFPGGAPTKESAQALKDELFFQRATQIYLWAMPVIMTLGMQVGSEKAFGAGYNVLPIWKQLIDAKTLVITPNTVTLYAVNYLDLGRMVLW